MDDEATTCLVTEITGRHDLIVRRPSRHTHQSGCSAILEQCPAEAGDHAIGYEPVEGDVDQTAPGAITLGHLDFLLSRRFEDPQHRVGYLAAAVTDAHKAGFLHLEPPVAVSPAGPSRAFS